MADTDNPDPREHPSVQVSRTDHRAAGDAEPTGRRPDGVLSNQVVEVLRAAGQALTPAQVQQALAEIDPRPLAYTTIVTVLSRLHAQGLADRYRAGRAFAYVLVADHSRLAARRMRRVLDAEADRGGVLASFVDDLSNRDEEILRRLLGINSDLPGRDT